MVEQVNEPSWQEMDKAKAIISNITDGTNYHIPDALKEEIFVQLRKVVLESARISN
ncbi:hypothetical protein [Acinetobacter baumannii]|uniref:hypothetical protein n=1 Tax=Acinetobacter baumannii TaxID=470 RepID=UPI00148EC376|nr:hypothetical protein [Acinetobacter baumannii]MBU0372169.1 hypothetical protein [Acinetobacter baumannii]MBU0422290.1 hypothetical protein [Acinetobacter baumannii]MDF7764690.1 hypothetical protein [Acinetobacter baumannii]UMM96297.1 hypothetical protein L2Z45_07410 [Acinetobacter baumannii]UMN38671.1 hypothetical protein L2Z12_19320 [Acinetobacter baumannii]